MNFIHMFLKYVDSQGIYDEFDKDSQKMVTSAGVQALIKEAATYVPAKLKPLQAANAMRDLTDAERDKLIQDSDQERIVDLRRGFQLRMSENKGAQGIVERLVEATQNPDVNLTDIILDAQALVNGPEHIFKDVKID